MELTVVPADGLVDEVPTVIARGLRPDEPVVLTVEVRDAAGNRWRSVNEYRADAQGVVDTATSAPDHGSYPGVDPAGPWWSMTPADGHGPRRDPATFEVDDDRLTWTVDCAPADSAPAARRSVVRRWRAAQVTRSDSVLDGLRHVRFSPGPPLGPAPPVVVLVPGPAGVGTAAATAALLASRCGLTATVLADPDEREGSWSLCELPLERLARGIAAAAGGSAAEPPRAAVVAYSAGTAGALTALALELIPVRAVVALAPTHVVWQASASKGSAPDTSSLSHLGVPLPYVPVRGDRPLPGPAAHALLRWLPGSHDRSRAAHTRPAYEAALRHGAAVGAAVIPVERIAAPLMAVAGTADEVWPAEAMARALIERHRGSPHAHTGPDGDVLLVNRGAGHFVRPPLVPTTVDRDAGLDQGGSPAADAAAQQATWTAMTRFLRRHLDRP